MRWEFGFLEERVKLKRVERWEEEESAAVVKFKRWIRSEARVKEGR